MKFKLLVFFLVLFFSGCKTTEEKIPTPASPKKNVMDYLTDGSAKNWKLIRNAPLDAHPSCNASSVRSLDDYFTFKSDFTYYYNHGTVTIDPNDSYCSDAQNFSGIFKLIERDTKIILQITTLTDTNTPDNSEPADTVVIYQINDNQMTMFEKGGAVTDTSVFAKK